MEVNNYFLYGTNIYNKNDDTGTRHLEYDDNSILLKRRHFDTDMQINQDMSITYQRQVHTRFFNKRVKQT